MTKPSELSEPIPIGISSCLLGKKVRYDGGHKHDRYITDTLGRYFQWVPVCPEVESGMTVPRPALRLEQRGEEVRMIVVKTGDDVTDRMRQFSEKRAAQLEKLELCGYLLKNRSPSCGMERVKVYDGGRSLPQGRGVFAQVLLERFPQLPITEEGRLHDPGLRENWITRVFAYHRLQGLWKTRWTLGQLVRFHTVHKYLLLAHDQAQYRRLGKLVADAKQIPRKTLQAEYQAIFMAALAKNATPAKNTNVLQHILGFFKKDIDAAARQELLGLIADYRAGLAPLIVPLTLIAHYVRLLDVEYLRDQVYLNPHPKELALRS